MDKEGVGSWVSASRAREACLLGFDQPLTAMQLCRRLGVTADSCGFLLWELSSRGVLRCLTQRAAQNRLHWLTRHGIACQRVLREQLGLGVLETRCPRVDWDLYAGMCFRHRSAVIRGMNGPMRPPEIRKRAVARIPGLRMSRNNCRDVLRLLLEKDVVRETKAGGIEHPHYSLTDLGRTFRELLQGAEHSA